MAPDIAWAVYVRPEPGRDPAAVELADRTSAVPGHLDQPDRGLPVRLWRLPAHHPDPGRPLVLATGGIRLRAVPFWPANRRLYLAEVPLMTLHVAGDRVARQAAANSHLAQERLTQIEQVQPNTQESLRLFGAAAPVPAGAPRATWAPRSPWLHGHAELIERAAADQAVAADPGSSAPANWPGCARLTNRLRVLASPGPRTFCTSPRYQPIPWSWTPWKRLGQHSHTAHPGGGGRGDHAWRAATGWSPRWTHYWRTPSPIPSQAT